MAKMPFFQFYPLDWLRDTRQLSHEARGVWINVLCLAWNEPQRGIYKRRVDMAANDIGLEVCSGTPNCAKSETLCPFHRVLNELSYVADVTFRNHEVTIKSRRMIKEETERNKNVEKQRRYRSNHEVTAALPNVTCKKLEVRSQKLEVRELQEEEGKPPPNPFQARRQELETQDLDGFIRRWKTMDPSERRNRRSEFIVSLKRFRLGYKIEDDLYSEIIGKEVNHERQNVESIFSQIARHHAKKATETTGPEDSRGHMGPRAAPTLRGRDLPEVSPKPLDDPADRGGVDGARALEIRDSDGNKA